MRHKTEKVIVGYECPYCGKELNSISYQYYCENSKCTGPEGPISSELRLLPVYKVDKEKARLGEYILDCMSANQRVGNVSRCPNCQSAVTITQEGAEEHVVCNGCGLVAIDGSIVVRGA